MGRWLFVVLLAVVTMAPTAAAQPQPSPPAEPEPEEPPDPKIAEAEAAWKRGLELFEKAECGKAITEFRRVIELTDAGAAHFNIAYCLYATGHYVEARTPLKDAIARGNELVAAQLLQAKALGGELEKRIVKLNVQVIPHKDVRLTVNGRQLVKDKGNKDSGVYVLGAPATKGTVITAKTFALWVNPGAYQIAAKRPGHADAIVKKRFRQGKRETVKLELNKLPSYITVQSEPKEAQIFLDNRWVGDTPFVEREFPPGPYALRVEKEGYDPQEAKIVLEPGLVHTQELTLELYSPPLYERWWFWVTMAGAIGTAAVATYFITRPEPEPPPYDGGSTGWVVEPMTLRF